MRALCLADHHNVHFSISTASRRPEQVNTRAIWMDYHHSAHYHNPANKWLSAAGESPAEPIQPSDWPSDRHKQAMEALGKLVAYSTSTWPFQRPGCCAPIPAELEKDTGIRRRPECAHRPLT